MKATQMHSVKGIVESLLATYPTYRDDDRKLFAHLWMLQIGGIEKMKEVSFYDFMKDYVADTKWYSPEHVSRLRRKVQEENPLLRGEKYAERKVTEQQVRSQFSK